MELMTARGSILWVVAVFAIFTLMIGTVHADITPPPAVVSLYNCTLSRNVPGAAIDTSAVLACGQTVWAWCRVFDTTSSASTITSVTFAINTSSGSASHAATLYAGTARNGTWGYSFVETGTTGTPSLASAQAISSTGTVCSGATWQDTGLCHLEYADATRTFASGNTCSCQYTNTTVCGVNNVQTVTKTPNAGCSDTTPIVTHGVCDYCDPNWVPLFSACMPESATFLTQGNFVGNATKTYTSANPSCCSATGLASDCTPPADQGAVVACKQDHWTTGGRDAEGNSQNKDVSQFSTQTVNFTRAGSFAQGQTDDVLRPLSFDYDNDGNTEIISFTTTGFQTHGVTLGTPKDSQSHGHTIWQGQPALFGFNQYADTAFLAQDDGNQNPLVGVAGIAFDSGLSSDFFVSKRYENGSWVLKQNVNLNTALGIAPGIPAASSSGVACWQNECYFRSIDNRLIKMNAVTGTFSQVTLSASSTTDVHDSVPIFTTFTGGNSPVPGAVVVEGVDQVGPDFVAAVFACTLDLGNCTEITTAAGPGNISRIAASGPLTDVERGGILGPSVKIYFTYSYIDTEDEAVVVLESAVLSDDMTFSNIAHSTVGGIGGTFDCLSDPATARCPGPVNGVVVASHWTTESAPIHATPALNFKLDAVQSIASPLTDTQAEGTQCWGKSCIMLEEVNNAALQDTINLYYMSDFGPYQNIGHPTGEMNVSHEYGVCASDGLVGVGISQGDVYAIYGDPVGVFTACATPGSLTNLTVWRYKTSTGVWQQLSSSLAYQVKVRARLQHLLDCTDDGCALPVSNGTRENVNLTGFGPYSGSVYIDADSGSVSLHQMRGDPTYNVNGVTVQNMFRTSSARYYVVTTTTPRDFLVRYADSTPTIPGTVDSTEATSEFVIGATPLDTGSDAIVWAKIPTQGATSCTTNSTDTLHSNIWWQGTDETIQSGMPTTAGPTVTNNQTLTCTYTLKTANAGAVATTYTESIIRRARVTGAPAVYPTANRLGANGGTDENSIPFVTFFEKDLFFDGNGGASLDTPVRISSEGTSHPLLFNVSNVNATSTNHVANYGAYVPCAVITVGLTGAGCRPYASFTTGTGFNIFPPAFDSQANYVDPFLLVGSVQKIAYYSNVATAVSSDYTEYSCYGGLFGSLERISGTVNNEAYCPKSIATFDVNNDGIDEVVSASGIFRTEGSAKIMDFPNPASTTAVTVADVNSDFYGDIELVTPLLLKVIVSNPSISLAQTAHLQMASIACSVDDSTSTVSVIPVGVGAQHPGALTFSAAVTSLPGSAPYSATIPADTNAEKSISLPLVSGAYTITMTVRDPLATPEIGSLDAITLVSKSCNVSVVAPIVPVDVGNTPSCTVGVNNVDGDFNWVGTVDDIRYNWLLGLGSSRPTLASSALPLSTTTDVIHGLECGDAGLQVDLRMKAAAGAGTKIFIDMTDGVSVGGNAQTSVVVGGLEIQNGFLNAYTDTGLVSLGVMSTSYENVTLIFDVASQKFTVSVNGAPIGEFNWASIASGKFIGVEVHQLTTTGGTTTIDYIHTKGTQGLVRDTNVGNTAKYTGLANCLRSQYSDTGYDPHNRNTSYAHISEYCAGIATDSGNTFCSYTDLQNAIKYNSDCWNEAYQYCVQVSYPKSQGSDLGVTSVVQSGLDGASVCGSILGITTTTDRIAVPAASSVWGILTTANNWMYVVGIFVVIIIVGTLRRKGG